MEFSDGIECYPALAGYLQFVGVSVAILGSAKISYLDNQTNIAAHTTERAGRAKVLTYRLLSAVTDIQQTTVRIDAQIPLTYCPNCGGAPPQIARLTLTPPHTLQNSRVRSTKNLKKPHILSNQTLNFYAQKPLHPLPNHPPPPRPQKRPPGPPPPPPPPPPPSGPSHSN